MRDMLRAMFDMQKILQKRITGCDHPRYEPAELPNVVTSIIGELGEILEEEQGWKLWRKNPPAADRKKLVGEYADLAHFIINLGLNIGVDADELFDAFSDKNALNHKRQNEEY